MSSIFHKHGQSCILWIQYIAAKLTPFLMFSFDKCSFWNIWRLRYVFIGHQALLCIQDQRHFDYSWYGCFWVVLCHDVEIKPLQTSTELQAVSLWCACITKLLISSPVVPHFYLVQCIHVCKCMWFSAYTFIANWIMWPNGYEQHQLQLQFYWGCSPSLGLFCIIGKHLVALYQKCSMIQLWQIMD